MDCHETLVRCLSFSDFGAAETILLNFGLTLETLIQLNQNNAFAY